MAQNPKAQKSVAVLVYPQVSMLELTGAYSTFNGLRMAKYEVAIVAEHLEAIHSDTPLKVVPHKTFQDLPSPTVLVVMGGGVASLKALGNPALGEYVRAAASSADHVIGIGTGSLLMAACDLLQGLPATTHWAYAGLLEAFGAHYERRRWVESGKFITCAGGTGGMDMGLKFLATHAGEANARIFQLFAEYDPDPPFGAIDWSQVTESIPIPTTRQEIEAVQLAVADRAKISQAINHWTQKFSLPV